MANPKVIGKYQFLAPLAAGPFTEVWLVRAEAGAPSSPLVVAKRLAPKLAGNAAVAREFLAQAKLAAQLEHPSIGRVLDLVRAGDDTFVVRELVRGVSLAAIIAQIGDLGVQSVAVKYAALIASSAAAALHHAFGAKDAFGLPLEVVHAGVTPQNIFITMDGGVVVTDFGLTRALRHTKRGEIPVTKGRALYFSPEQWRGQEPTHRADVFSLGVVLWELLTGKRLHDRADPKAIVNAACVEPAPPPSSLQRHAPREIDEVTRRALAKDPDGRYATADEMHHALEAHLTEHAKDASPETLAGYVAALLPEQWKSWQMLKRAEAAGDGARVLELANLIFKGRRINADVATSQHAAARPQDAAPVEPRPPAAPTAAPVVPPSAEKPALLPEPAPSIGGRELEITDRIPQLVAAPAPDPRLKPATSPSTEREAPQSHPEVTRFGESEPPAATLAPPPGPSADPAFDPARAVVSALFSWKGGIVSEAVADAARPRIDVGSAPGCDITVPEECVAGAPLTIVVRTPTGWRLNIPKGWQSSASAAGTSLPLAPGVAVTIAQGDFSIVLALAPAKAQIRTGLARSIDWSFASKVLGAAAALAAVMVFAIFFVKQAPMTSDSPAVQRHVKFLVSAVKTAGKKERPPPPKEDKTEKLAAVKESKATAKGSVNVPKWVQPKRSTGKVDDLIASLAAPAGGKSLKDSVANLDAIKGGSSSSLMGAIGDFVAPGGLSGLGGLGGGGGDVGTLGGDAVTRGVGKVGGGGGGGRVRGSVSGVKALAKIDGSLDRELVLKAINESQHQVQACYERALVATPGISGKITFEWTIDPAGKVSKAAEKSSTMGSPKVSECILGVIKRMKFPRPQGGSVIITFPFMFRSVS